MTKIKICGLRRPEDMEMVNTYLPDYCGFIINFPKSHRSISPEMVRTLVNMLDRKNVSPVGVFVDEDIQVVESLLLDGTIDMAQLHGSEDEEYIKILKKKTGKKVIKAFAVRNRKSLEAAAESSADHVLLDQGQGTGQTFDWSILGSEDAKAVFGGDGTPGGEWFLAGGLSAGNIVAVIERFRPFAVDLSSAVETEKFKDPAKVREIIALVRGSENI